MTFACAPIPSRDQIPPLIQGALARAPSASKAVGASPPAARFSREECKRTNPGAACIRRVGADSYTRDPEEPFQQAPGALSRMRGPFC